MDLYTGRHLKVERRSFLFPDGKEREKVIIHPGDAVAVLPIADETCFLIRQFRFAVGTSILEAPAGKMNEGETPGEAARREMAEETGMVPGKLVPRGFLYTTPGFTDERIFLFEGRDLSPALDHSPDEDEFIEVVQVPLTAVRAMIRDGSISDAKTIALVFRCLC